MYMKISVKALLSSIVLGGLLLFGIPNQAAAQDVYSYTAPNGVKVYVDTDSIEWITLNDTTFNVDVHLSNGGKDSLHYYKDYHDGVWKCQLRDMTILPVYKYQMLQAIFDTVCSLRYQ